MARTIFRRGAFRFFFFSREEPRMHVHVAHTDGKAKFWLEPQIDLAMNQGLPNKQLNEATIIGVSIALLSLKNKSGQHDTKGTESNCFW